MKDKKLILKVVIILFTICVILLVILIAVFQKKQNEPVVLKQSINTRTDRYLKLGGFGIFFEQYDGELTSSEISKKLEQMTTQTLPEVYAKVKDLNEKTRKDYFDNYSSEIESDFGIKEYNEFDNFIHKIEETGIDVEQWESLMVIKESFKNDSDVLDYAYVEYEVSYNNEQKITYSMYLSKVKTKKPNYIINIK